MRLIFTEEQKERDLNKIYLEEDELTLEGEFVEGEGKSFTITGVATIEGERYHDFQVVFELKEETDNTLEAIMNAEWDWYDFNF